MTTAKAQQIQATKEEMLTVLCDTKAVLTNLLTITEKKNNN
jgi:hypothetical protein